MNDRPFEPSHPEVAPRLHFDTTLVYAASDAFRISCTIVGFGLGGLGMWAAWTVFRLDPGRIQNMVEAVLILIVAIWLASLSLQGSVRILLLGQDGIAIPVDPTVTVRWPYADVAGYALAPHHINLGLRGRFKGQSLSLKSLRAGVAPLVVFVFDDYPMSRQMLRRLDEVVQANRNAPSARP